MDIKSLKEIDVENKTVLMRVDYNVKFNDKGEVKDATRIRESLDSIEYVINNNGKLVLMMHLGRPDGKENKEDSAEKIIPKLEELLRTEKKINKKVIPASNCFGDEVQQKIRDMDNGDILLLENLRFHPEEEKFNPLEDVKNNRFVKSLADLCDIYVFDGFGVAHRTHASTAGVPLYLIQEGKKPVAMGILMERELKLWSEAREIANKKGNYTLLVVGGNKLEEKTEAVGKLYKYVNGVLVGGAVYNIIENSILKKQGGEAQKNVGSSLITEKGKDYTPKGGELYQNCNNLILSTEAVIAKKDKEKGTYEDRRTISIKDGVPADYMICDIVVNDGIARKINQADVIIWFGNIGMSDVESPKGSGGYPFAVGTESFKKAINSKAYVIVGGGDSVEASKGMKNIHISTGGGAAIELYIKGTLDALEALKGNINYLKEKYLTSSPTLKGGDSC